MFSVLLFGATGSVGSQILKHLYTMDQVSKIILISRREMEVPAEYKEKGTVHIQVVDYDNLQASKNAVGNCDYAFCALGTTRAKSGAEGFYKVDHDYVVSAAELSKNAGCKKFALISSQGADENSRFLYMKTKGEAERDTKAFNFDSHIIARPGFLRERNDFRLGEKVIDVFMAPIRLFTPLKMSIECDKVAKGVIFKTFAEGLVEEVLDNAELYRLSEEFDKCD